MPVLSAIYSLPLPRHPFDEKLLPTLQKGIERLLALPEDQFDFPIFTEQEIFELKLSTTQKKKLISRQDQTKSKLAQLGGAWAREFWLAAQNGVSTHLKTVLSQYFKANWSQTTRTPTSWPFIYRTFSCLPHILYDLLFNSPLFGPLPIINESSKTFNINPNTLIELHDWPIEAARLAMIIAIAYTRGKPSTPNKQYFRIF